MHVHLLRPEVDAGYQLQSLSTFCILRQGLSSDLAFVHCFTQTGWPASPIDPPVPTSLTPSLEESTSMPSFFVGAGNVSLGVKAYVAHT